MSIACDGVTTCFSTMKLALGSAAAAHESGDEGAGEPAGALGGQHKEGHVEALITMPSRVLSVRNHVLRTRAEDVRLFVDASTQRTRG